MTSQAPDEALPKRGQALKVTGFTFVITNIANKIPDPVIKDWVLSLSPLIGFVVNLIYNFSTSCLSTIYTVNRINMMISELEARKNETGGSSAKIKELEKEIDDLRKAIKKRRLKELNIQI